MAPAHASPAHASASARPRRPPAATSAFEDLSGCGRSRHAAVTLSTARPSIGAGASGDHWALVLRPTASSLIVGQGRLAPSSLVHAGRVVAISAVETKTRRTPRVRTTRSSRRRVRSRRRRHAWHGDQLRPRRCHQVALVVATDAPPIRREAWATLQEWAVCSSIFVVPNIFCGHTAC